ncbi:hypothetical protein [Saliphagus sp. LR7]|uniref:DUF7384 family protein n=1 Tax=Saliphagus sp. LR7 TaxID=2282654 RepID=UPI000DF7438A|nr:hypothetical protein [Saliphagus sp. LR7]
MAEGADGDRFDDAGRDDRPDPTRVVADSGVLAADLLVGGAAREALDHVRAHSWMGLVASDPLLEETEELVATLADADLAAAHHERLEADRVAVTHPEDDHPALASAYHGNAAHLLTESEELASPGAGIALQPHVRVSVRPPDAFARLFDPESLYEAERGGEYPGPDCDPRA